MKVITADAIFDDFAIIVELKDEQVEQLQSNPLLSKDIGFMTEAMKAKGDNAHVVSLTLFTDVTIANHIDRLLSDYKTVSWVHNNKFYIRRKTWVYA